MKDDPLSCKFCAAWNGNGRGWCSEAECRNESPKIKEVVGGVARPMWPTTRDSDWCKQFQHGPHTGRGEYCDEAIARREAGA